MIKKTLITAFALLSLYIVFRDYLYPEITIAATQQQKNQIKAQNYLYGEVPLKKYAIVGSSMSARLPSDSLNNFTILAFDGESPYQGLELITKRDDKPKVVFIETNVVLKTSNSFENTLYNPILYPLRKYIKTFRDGKEPLPLIKNFTESKILKYDIIPYYLRLEPDMEVIKRQENKKEQIKKELEQAHKTQIIPSDKQIEEAEKKLKHYISTLETACKSVASEAIRTFLTNKFPPRQIHIYIPSVQCEEYETTDGIHLGEEEARKYVSFFKK